MARAREIEISMLIGKGPRSGTVESARSRKGTDSFDAPKKRPKKKSSKPELKGTRVWVRHFNVCGQRYAIKVDPSYSGDKWEGACTWSENLIEILAQAEDRMHDALLHEIVHALTDACGFKWTARQLMKLTAKQNKILDELICRLFAPALLGTLRDAGWLHLPRKPGSRVVPKRAAS